MDKGQRRGAVLAIRRARQRGGLHGVFTMCQAGGALALKGAIACEGLP